MGSPTSAVSNTATPVSGRKHHAPAQSSGHRRQHPNHHARIGAPTWWSSGRGTARAHDERAAEVDRREACASVRNIQQGKHGQLALPELMPGYHGYGQKKGAPVKSKGRSGNPTTGTPGRVYQATKVPPMKPARVRRSGGAQASPPRLRRS